jgi:hypothetical protein
MTFQLDTSGIVYGHGETDARASGYKTWANLGPFTQGYIEALMVEASRLAAIALDDDSPSPGFSDLAPETLARIIEDCAAIQSTFPVSPNYPGGWQAWCVRQGGGFDMAGKWPGLPPLTVTLGDDGKVRFQ